MPWSDVPWLLASVLLAVLLHEAGHALAAGAEGVPMSATGCVPPPPFLWGGFTAGHFSPAVCPSKQPCLLASATATMAVVKCFPSLVYAMLAIVVLLSMERQ